MGFAFIRHSTHTTTRVCYPTNSPRAQVASIRITATLRSCACQECEGELFLGFFRLRAIAFITRESKEVVCRKTKAGEYTHKTSVALVPHVEKLNHEVKH